MENQRTCGQGLAEHAALPAKLGALTAATAENLELHMKALDLTDASSQKEHAAYAKLAQEHRETAERLRAIAKEMAGYRDLPMGRHDMAAMASPSVVRAFERFVTLEQELLTLLQTWVQRDKEMLSEMHGARAAAR